MKNTEENLPLLPVNDAKTVLCFGELLLRICPDVDGRWLQQNSLPFFVGGAEANVASALALWQTSVAYCSVVPDNFISHQLLGYLQAKRIDTSRTVFNGNKLGLYFLPKGEDVKHAGVIYDRAGSSFATIQPGTIDWNSVLQNISWLHFTAISPALSQNIADVCLEVLQVASSKNITVSIDLNYRPKLWQYGKTPEEIMPTLVQYCDVVMGNIWAVEKMLGIPIPGLKNESMSKDVMLDCAEAISGSLMSRYNKIKIVANTFRFDYLERGIEYFATVSAKDSFVVSKHYRTETIVDKVGSGDCFMAGLIFGLKNNWPLQQVADFAATAAFLKLFVEGDATNAAFNEIIKFKETYENK